MDSQQVGRIIRSAAAGSLLMLSAGAVMAGHHGLFSGSDRPQTSAACQPNWGYNQTCWRRFPAVPPCDSCLTGDLSGENYPETMSPPGQIYVPQTAYGTPYGGENAWQPSQPAVSGSGGHSPEMNMMQDYRTAPGSSLPSPSPQAYPSMPQMPRVPSSGLPGASPALPPLPGGLQPVPDPGAGVPHQSRYGQPTQRYASSQNGLLLPQQDLVMPAPHYIQQPSVPFPQAVHTPVSSGTGGRYGASPGRGAAMMLPHFQPHSIPQPVIPAAAMPRSVTAVSSPARYPGAASLVIPSPGVRQPAAVGYRAAEYRRNVDDAEAVPLIPTSSGSGPRLYPVSTAQPLRRTP